MSATTNTKKAETKFAPKTTTNKAETKTAAKTADSADSVGKEISNTFGGSPVTSELSDNATNGDQTIDLRKAKITVPQSAIETAPASSAANEPSQSEMDDFEKNEKSFNQRVMDAGIGLVQVEGIDFRYIGIAPARDKDAKTPNGYPITTDNSRFTPLSDVVFNNSLRFKDTKSGEYYYATDAATFAEVSLKDSPLVPTESDKVMRNARHSTRFGG